MLLHRKNLSLQKNMPQTISLYKLFLASPSDVKEERLIVENVINDFYNTYSSQLNARIELCSWEKSSYPSVGEYPQAVINSLIGDEYDFFLGILWTRFGSKTHGNQDAYPAFREFLHADFYPRLYL